jgi:hypothetical protein
MGHWNLPYALGKNLPDSDGSNEARDLTPAKHRFQTVAHWLRAMWRIVRARDARIFSTITLLRPEFCFCAVRSGELTAPHARADPRSVRLSRAM